jgi:aldehyde dehydrogenase (NAD+)
VFDAVYDAFRGKLLAGTAAQKVGPADTDDFGPVINARQLENMEGAVAEARARGASVIAGGRRLPREGFFMAPTLLEEVAPGDPISRTELFGPVACLYRVPDFEAALALANDSPYGLTACIHTRSVHRALEFSMRVQAGVAMVNAGTFGSEPHLPFGGVKDSGNGTREPGTEALDVYSTLKNICVITEPART